MDKITLTQALISRICQHLNRNGYVGHRKDLSLRVDLDTGVQSFNTMLMGDNDDMLDIAEIRHWRGEPVELADGVAKLEVWTYWRGRVSGYPDVYLAPITGDRVAIFDHHPDNADLLRAAVRWEARGR